MPHTENKKAPREYPLTPSETDALRDRVQESLYDGVGEDGRVLCGMLGERASIDFSLAASATRDAPTLAPHAPFRIASVTKPYVAAAIFRLWEDGLLDLRQPISELIQPQTNAILTQGGYATSDICVKHLLAHTGGVYDHCHDPVFEAAILHEPERRWTRLEQIAFAAEHGAPYGPPESGQHYSDTGYLILGEIIEAASGAPLGGALRSLLRFDRLGLIATRLEDESYTEDAANPVQHARFHDRSTGSFDPSFDLFGGGGLVSTAREICVFMRALLTGGVFERSETLAAALAMPATPHDPSNNRIRSYLLYRYEWLGAECWGHTGFWGTEALYCPTLDLAVTLTVFEGGDKGSAKRLALREMIERAMKSVL